MLRHWKVLALTFVSSFLMTPAEPLELRSPFLHWMTLFDKRRCQGGKKCTQSYIGIAFIFIIMVNDCLNRAQNLLFLRDTSHYIIVLFWKIFFLTLKTNENYAAIYSQFIYWKHNYYVCKAKELFYYIL